MDSEQSRYKNLVSYLKKQGFSEEMLRRDVLVKDKSRIDAVIYIRNKPVIATFYKSGLDNINNIFSANVDAEILKIPFFIVTNGEEFKWYKTSEISKKNTTRPQVTRARKLKDFIPNIAAIQDEVFTFLYKKHLADNNFCFQVRQSPSQEYIDKGYWFDGNDFWLFFSLWDGKELEYNRAFITFNISISLGSMSLLFSTKISNKVRSFAKQLAPVLGLKPDNQSIGEINYYSKTYYERWQGDYIEVLEEFIKTEKATIDNAILVETRLKNNDLDGLDIIVKKDFEKDIAWIWKHRDEPKKDAKNINYADYPIVPQSLELKNIGHYQHLELDINARIICLFGENGIGKTTVLRSFLIALAGTASTVVDLNDLRFQRMLRILDIKEDGFMRYANNGQITLNYTHYAPSVSQVNFILQENKVHIEEGLASNKPSFTTIEDHDYFTQLIVGFSQVQGRQSQLSEDGLNKVKRANIRDIIPLLSDIEDNRFQDLSDWIIGLYGQSLEDKNGQEKGILAKIFDLISEITGSWINLDKVNFIDRIIWVHLDGQSIPFSLLSQGYKNVFAWVGHFIRRLAEANEYKQGFMHANAILVIDEIDTYLHPKWQRNILNVLAKYFIATRFIVTTHSPLVANYLEEKDSAIYILGKDSAEKVTHVYGRELSYIFRKLMSIDDRPKELQEKIDKLFDWLDEDSEQSMADARLLFKELAEQLGEEDSDLVQAKTYLELSDYQ